MTTLTDDQIIGELTTWAAKRARVADPTVLAAVLAARPAGRRRDPSVWGPGEVQEALLAAVAADPCLFLTDADVLRESLDSFFRFLRNTGRLHSSSADVAVLRKEAARAVRELEQTFGDVRRLWACAEPDEDRWDRDRWDAEDPDDWLHPDDPRHLARELLRDLGVDGPLAVPLPPPWRQLLATSGVVHCRIDHLLEEGTGSGVVALLVESLIVGPAGATLTEAADTGRRRDHGFDRDESAARALAELEHGVALLAEAGVLEREGHRVRLTDFGRWVVVDWLERQFS